MSLSMLKQSIKNLSEISENYEKMLDRLEVSTNKKEQEQLQQNLLLFKRQMDSLMEVIKEQIKEEKNAI